MKTLLRFVLTISFFAMFFLIFMELAKDAPVTANFGEDAPYFHVLGTRNGQYEVLYLKRVQEEKDAYKYYLEESRKKIVLADQSYAEILEVEEGVQRIKLFYKNTYMSESIYEVSENGIRPVEYRVLGSMGHLGRYLVVIVVAAVFAALLSRWVIYRWTGQRKQDTNV